MIMHAVQKGEKSFERPAAAQTLRDGATDVRGHVRGVGQEPLEGALRSRLPRADRTTASLFFHRDCSALSLQALFQTGGLRFPIPAEA